VIGGGEIPYRWELGFTHLPKTDQRHVLVGQNFSPAIVQDAMLNSVLPWTPLFLDADEPIGLFLHRITPARQTLDYGKTELDVGGDERAAVRVALEKIAAPWIKRRNAELRGKKPPPERKPERVTFQDAAFSTMAAAYDAASSEGKYPVLSQQVFYKARPTILELTGKEELSPGERARFCYTLLPQFTCGIIPSSRSAGSPVSARAASRTSRSARRPASTSATIGYASAAPPWTRSVSWARAAAS
jgi:hypothetical protein